MGTPLTQFHQVSASGSRGSKCANRAGNSVMAIAGFSRAIELNPEDTPAYYNRGLVYRDLQRLPSPKQRVRHLKQLRTSPKRLQGYPK